MTDFTPISAPGIYDIPAAAYHADPCPVPSLSNSIAKRLVGRSPLHAWCEHPRLNPDWRPIHRREFDLGRAVHAVLLDDDVPLVPISADSYRTKAAKELRDEAYAADAIPLLTHQHDTVWRMEKAARRQLEVHEDGALFLAEGCRSEVSMGWKEGETWARSRVDRVSPDRRVLFDYKTTGGSAHPEQWGGVTAFQLGFDMQSAFYRRGWHALHGYLPTFFFIVQEIDPPHALTVVSLDAEAEAVGEAKVDRAFKLWRHCMAKDIWPPYPNQTAYVGAPYRQAERWLDNERGGPISTTDEQIMALVNNWQAPLEPAE